MARRHTRSGPGQLRMFLVPGTDVARPDAPTPPPGPARGIRGRPIAEEYTAIVRRIATDATQPGRAWIAAMLIGYATGMPETSARSLIDRITVLRRDYHVPDPVILRVLNPPRRKENA